jgi:sugar phosphate isomerase/epimerase
MLEEMAALGFERVELSHGIRITLVPGILKALEAGVVKVGSIHNICPLPTGFFQAAPNCYEPSAPEHKERDQWLRHTKRSLDFAGQIGAKVLVCHLGSVRYLWLNPGNRLSAYLDAHPDTQVGTDEAYRALAAKALAKLRAKMGPYWQHTQEGILAVLDHAKSKGVTLGLENRERFEELPIDSDYPGLLSGLPQGAPAGYWHDVGHAHIKESMGLIGHRQQLEDNASRTIGFHLHDVTEKGDHQAVGTGAIDFGMVSSFWRPEHLFVLELGPRISAEDVLRSKERLEALLPVGEAPSNP